MEAPSVQRRGVARPLSSIISLALAVVAHAAVAVSVVALGPLPRGEGPPSPREDDIELSIEARASETQGNDTRIASLMPRSTPAKREPSVWGRNGGAAAIESAAAASTAAESAAEGDGAERRVGGLEGADAGAPAA